MLSNPFTCHDTFLQMALSEEMYQRIHALAIYRAIQGYASSAIPQHIQVDSLRQQVATKGPDICLWHPAELARLFAGVTLAVYHTIEALYCSRVGRSIFTVWRVLETMAYAAQAQPLDYEAVWAICVYLERQRQSSIMSNIERGQERWWVGTLAMDLSMRETSEKTEAHLLLLCAVDLSHRRVLSLRISPKESMEQHSSLVLYDAFCLQRRPHQRASTGVLWHLPKCILAEIPLLADSQRACKRLGIALETAPEPLPFVQALRATVMSLLRDRILSLRQCLLLLDRCLGRTFGCGPLSMQAQCDQKNAHLKGYSQEPTWLFPLLRAFLPSLPAIIDREGSIEIDHLHYTDELLLYFSNRAVTIRRLAHTEAGIWVYLDGSVLCQAWARELRRRDGTYRPSRPGR
jgi:hypothetical protein